VLTNFDQQSGEPDMGEDIPALGILIDLPLAFLMWAAILRFLLSMVIQEDSRTPVMRFLNSFIMPIVHVSRFFTPSWVIERLAPLYLAFWVFILRYYVMPLFIGYDINGFGSLSIEYLLILVWIEYGF
jgi:hypothetical protein